MYIISMAVKARAVVSLTHARGSLIATWTEADTLIVPIHNCNCLMVMKRMLDAEWIWIPYFIAFDVYGCDRLQWIMMSVAGLLKTKTLSGP